MYFLQRVPRHGARLDPGLCLFLVGVCCSVAPADEGDDPYAAAVRQYADRSWTSAAAAFDAFAKDYPQHPRAVDAQFFAGEALLQSKDYEPARRQFLDFIQRAPDHAYACQAQFRAGEALYLAGEAEAASRELAAFGAEYPDEALNAYALAYRAEIELHAKRFDAAAAIYRQSVKLFPDGSLQQQARFGLARALEGLGQSEQALPLYRSLSNQTQHELADNASLRLGVLLYQRGELEESIQVLARLENIPSTSDGEERDGRSSDLQHEARYWSGMATIDAGAPQDAVKIFETAARKAGDSRVLPGLWFGLAKANQAAGNQAAGLHCHQQVIDQWPQSLWADDSLQALLEAAVDRGDTDQFDVYAAAFERQFADGDLAPRIVHLLGKEALRRHDYPGAIARFESVVVGEGSDTFARKNRYFLSVAYLGAARFTEAFDIATQIETEPAEEELRRSLLKVRASACYELKNDSEAAKLLAACLRENLPANEAAEFRAKLAICQARVGDIAALRETLDSMRHQDTQASIFFPTIGYIAELMASSDEPELARELYTLLTLEGTPNAWVSKGLASLGRMQLQRGEVAESTKTFERLLAKSASTSEAPRAALLRARALQQADQSDTAVAAYRQLAEQYPGTDEEAIARFEAAKLLDRLGQDREAAELLRGLLQREPAFERRDAALYQLAWVLTDLQQAAAAEATFEELLQAFPESTFGQDVLYRLAERAFAANEPESAAARIQQLLDEDVQPLLLGHALYLQGQLAAKQLSWIEVIPPMQRLVQELPEHNLWLPANYWIAEAHFRSGDLDQAAAELAILREATIDSQAAWVPMVLLREAQVAAKQERWVETIDVARSIASRFPAFRLQHEVDYMIGRGLSAQGRFSEARDVFGRVVRSPIGSNTETAAMAQWMIGESFLHQKEYRYALRAYQRVISLHAYARWQSASLLQSGKCHEALGDWQEALKCYATLIQQYPTSEYADKASARMRIARREAVSTPLR